MNDRSRRKTKFIILIPAMVNYEERLKSWDLITPQVAGSVDQYHPNIGQESWRLDQYRGDIDQYCRATWDSFHTASQGI